MYSSPSFEPDKTFQQTRSCKRIEKFHSKNRYFYKIMNLKLILSLRRITFCWFKIIRCLYNFHTLLLQYPPFWHMYLEQSAFSHFFPENPRTHSQENSRKDVTTSVVNPGLSFLCGVVFVGNFPWPGCFGLKFPMAGTFWSEISRGRAVLVGNFPWPGRFGRKFPMAGPVWSEIFLGRAVLVWNFP